MFNFIRKHCMGYRNSHFARVCFYTHLLASIEHYDVPEDCEGCKERMMDQMSHMGRGGCAQPPYMWIAEDVYVALSEFTDNFITPANFLCPSELYTLKEPLSRYEDFLMASLFLVDTEETTKYVVLALIYSLKLGVDDESEGYANSKDANNGAHVLEFFEKHVLRKFLN